MVGKIRQAPCRACDAPLPVTRHRKVNLYPPVVLPGADNMWGGDFGIDHAPCPQCGEKRPLLRFSDLASGWVMWPAAAICVYIIWYVTHSHGGVTDDRQARVFLIVPFVIWPAIGFILWLLTRLLDRWIKT
jgi:hypothetical protein